jgi:integrase
MTNALATIDKPEVIEAEVLSIDSKVLATAAPTAADQHPAAVYLASLGEGSRRAMRGALDTVAGELTGGRHDAFTLDWGAVRFQHAQAARAALAARYAPAMANKCLAALRGALKAAWRLEQIPTEDYQRAIDVQAVRGSTLPRGRALTAGELRGLLQTCATDPTPAGTRDTALFALMYNTGIRRAEVVALDVADFDPQNGEIKVRSGKGNKGRTIYANANTRRALDSWLVLRKAATGSDAGPLFLPMSKSGRIVARRLNDQAVMDILLKRAGQAGIKNVSPHDFRRTFISDMLDAGVDTVTVQKMAGHSSPATTARYDRRGEQAKMKAAEVLHVPI